MLFRSLVLLNRIPELGYVEESSATWELCSWGRGTLIISKTFDGKLVDEHSEYAGKGLDEIVVYWVTKDRPVNVIGMDYAAYGNYASTQYLYMYVALFVDVGPAGDRRNIEDLEGVVWHTGGV